MWNSKRSGITMLRFDEHALEMSIVMPVINFCAVFNKLLGNSSPVIKIFPVAEAHAVYH